MRFSYYASLCCHAATRLARVFALLLLLLLMLCLRATRHIRALFSLIKRHATNILLSTYEYTHYAIE